MWVSVCGVTMLNSDSGYTYLCLQYPAYLAENESKLEASEVELYRKQYDLMTSICSVYEEEQPSDTATIKSERFEKLLDLMQQVRTVDWLVGWGGELVCLCVSALGGGEKAIRS